MNICYHNITDRCYSTAHMKEDKDMTNNIRTYYCIEDMKIYDEAFNEIGAFKYTGEVEGLTRITKNETAAMLNFCTEKDPSGWYILTADIPADVMATAAEKVYREMEGKR